MTTTSRLSLVAVGVAMVCGFSSTTARADAVAQAIINVSNFKIGLSDPTALGTPSFSNTVDSKGDLNGVQGLSTAIPNGATFCLGTCGSYVAGNVLLNGSPAVGTYAAGTSTITGNILGAGANSNTDAVVSLNPQGDGTSQGNTGVTVDFTFVLGKSSTVSFEFDAFTWLRAYLAAPTGGQHVVGTGVQATSTYSISITDSNGSPLFSWNPDGSVTAGGAIGGTEIADAANLNTNRGATASAANTQGTLDRFYGPASGHFAAVSNLLNAGTYNLSIRQTTLADANVTYIPEPASLALVGVALLGAGAVARRRKTQA